MQMRTVKYNKFYQLIKILKQTTAHIAYYTDYYNNINNRTATYAILDKLLIFVRALL